MRFLFAVRWKLGVLLGWDKPSAGVGARVASLRDRLPRDVRDAPRGPDNESMPLKAIYELDMESARELANKTVHTVMHLGWVQGANGDYELRMAVLVKPNGWFGRLYMAAIAPFRYLRGGCARRDRLGPRNVVRVRRRPSCAIPVLRRDHLRGTHHLGSAEERSAGSSPRPGDGPGVIRARRRRWGSSAESGAEEQRTGNVR
ncbi:DUF2867 domain-containing protein [Streptosporangium album]|uniref:DUF2867 domain-containing protein n=1 Tax=Streptosporangium album TaxID=47479 RepID=UPI0031E8B457